MLSLYNPKLEMHNDDLITLCSVSMIWICSAEQIPSYVFTVPAIAIFPYMMDKGYIFIDGI